MSDQLREALESHGCVEVPHSEDFPADECGVCTIDAAARRWLALTETGRVILWCETHASSAYGRGIECYYRCFVDPSADPCSIGSKFLADYFYGRESHEPQS